MPAEGRDLQRPAETAEGVKHAADPRASLPGGFSSVPPPAAGLHCLIKNGNTVFHCPDDLPDNDCGNSKNAAKRRQNPYGPADKRYKQHYNIHFFSLFFFELALRHQMVR
jgi:hypothetical protein